MAGLSRRGSRLVLNPVLASVRRDKPRGEARSPPGLPRRAGSFAPHRLDRALATAVTACHPCAMATPDKATCEVRIDGAWRLVPLVEAHAHHRGAEKRCPVCHGRVNTQGSYSGQGAVTMAHRRVHDGCPRLPRQYAGKPKPHPQAVE